MTRNAIVTIRCLRHELDPLFGVIQSKHQETSEDSCAPLRPQADMSLKHLKYIAPTSTRNGQSALRLGFHTVL